LSYQFDVSEIHERTLSSCKFQNIRVRSWYSGRRISTNYGTDRNRRKDDCCSIAFDLSAVVSAAPNLEIWTQHLDPINFGSNTGWLHPETAIQRGAKGTLINHAEHKVSIEHIAMLLDNVPEGFTICACAADIDEARALSALQPDYVAVEPPELIGGEISVTTADPEIVSGTARAIREISEDVGILCGAGVKNGQDVLKAIELGISGVLLASGVTKVRDAVAALNDLVSEL
jgi:triosephosphate isomerase